MKKIISIICSLFFISTSAQNFNPKILTLPQEPRSQDFSFLKEELKGVQVVMLGEKTHFDGNVFEMKTKIIEYLHQEMGFNTVAFESGVYDVWKAQKDITEGKNTKNAFLSSLFTIWAKRQEFQSFIDFYEKDKKLLKLYGFDNQITGKYGEEELIKDLYKYCKENQLKLKLNQDDFQLLLESMLNSGVFDEGDITYTQYKTTLTLLLNSIDSKTPVEDHFYWTQIIKSLLSLGEYYFNNEIILSSFYTTLNDNIRDKQMADNLLAYIKSHPNEKIICWGANQHFVNDMSSIKTPILSSFVPMTTYIKNALQDKVYSLAVVTAADSIYLQNKWYKTPLDHTSFEYYLKNKNQSYMFISSKQPEMRKIQLNRLFSPETFVEARLDLLHDGYLYFNKVIPSTPIDSDEKEIKQIDDSAINVANPSNQKEVKCIDSLLLSKNDSDIKMIALNEVIIYNKRTPYQIINKVIDNFEKNYPVVPFNSKMYTNISTNINDTTCLDFDFTSNQYDKSYTNNDRSTKQLKEIRWNNKNGYEPQNLREFHSLIYNNPIKYAPLLNKRKFSKFIFNLEEIKNYNSKQVYVINFSSPRNHSTFTKRMFLSNYSGILYINKDDYTVVKIFENWEVTKFPEEFRQGLFLKGSLAKYIKKDFISEAIETDFLKINNFYYISHSEIKILGKIMDIDNNSLPFKTIINSLWNDFNNVNVVPISNKDEEHIFNKINFDKTFWESYKMPK